MEDFTDSTTIVRSLRDLNKFLSNSNKSNDSSPRQKLIFSDTLNETRNFSDQSLNNDDHLSPGARYFRRQQNNIAGFDVSKKIREKDSELIDAQKVITHLESRIALLQETIEKDSVLNDKELGTLRSNNLRDKETIKDLQRKLKLSQNKEKEVIDENMQIQSSTEKKCSEIRAKMLQMQKEYLQRDEKQFNEISHLRKKVNELEENLNKATGSAHSSQFLAMQDEIKSMMSKIKKSEHTQLELETLKCSLLKTESKNKELQASLDKVEEFKNKANKFENMLVKMSRIEEERSKLKDENSTLKMTALNSDLLEEKLISAEEQTRLLESRCKDLNIENADLVSNQDQWKELESALLESLKLPGRPSVEDLKELLSLLLKGDKELCDTIHVLKESLKSHNATREKQDDLMRSYKVQLAKNQDEIQNNTSLIRRLQRKLMLISKERDNLKGIVASYESESTIIAANHDRERLLNLQSDLESYKREIGRLEKDLESTQGHSQTTKLALTDNKRISELEKRIEDLEQFNEELLSEKETLETRLEHQKILGGYDPNTTRVLEFKDNPAAKVKEEKKVQMERLQKENDALKSRIALLEAGETMNLTLKTGEKVGVDSATNKQLKDLQEKNNSLEKQNQRLIAIFKQKTAELRETVYRLTGYRVDVKGENYKVSSMFAESENDFLIFEPSPDGDLMMHETDYSCTVGNLVEKYLNEDGSYPAFLSALTLDLIEGRGEGARSPRPSSSEPEMEEEEEELAENETQLQEEEEEEEDALAGVGAPEEAEGDEPPYDEEQREEEPHEDEEEVEEEEYDDDEEEEGAEEEEELYDDDDELEDEDDEAPPPKRSRQEPSDDDDDDLICLD